MKEINIYRCEVDLFRKNGAVFCSSKERVYQRPNIRGVYYVGAKSEKEATKLLRDKIRFGSILTKPARKDDHYIQKFGIKDMKYKQIIKAAGNECIVI